MLTDQHNHTELIYWYVIQHCNMFRLFTSAIIRQPSVHKKNKKGGASVPFYSFCELKPT